MKRFICALLLLVVVVGFSPRASWIDDPPTKDSKPKLADWSDEDLFQALDSKDLSRRQQALLEVVRRGEKHRRVLLEWLKDEEKSAGTRQTVLTALLSFWNKDVQAAVVALLKDGPTELRSQACGALASKAPAHDQTAQEALLPLVQDDDLAVRRAAFLALGRINAAGAADHLVHALKFDDGKNADLREGLIRAIERTGKSGIDKLLVLGESGDDAQLALLLDVYPALRTWEAAAGLPRLLKNYHVKLNQQVKLLSAYRYYPPLDSKRELAPLEEFLTRLPSLDMAKGPAHRDDLIRVKIAVLEVLATSAALNADAVHKHLVDMLAEDANTDALPVIKAIESMRITSALATLEKRMQESQGPRAQRSALETLRGMALEYWVVGPFPADFKECPPPDKLPTLPFVLQGVKYAWTPLKSGPSGYLNLRAAFSKEAVSAYALTHVYSPKEQKVKLAVEGHEALRVWLGKELVLEQSKDNLKADSTQAEVTLPMDWTAVLVHVASTRPEFGFGLRFAGGEGLRLSLRRDQRLR